MILLRRINLKNYFKQSGTDCVKWWHFDYQGWQDQPILDVIT